MTTYDRRFDLSESLSTPERRMLASLGSESYWYHLLHEVREATTMTDEDYECEDCESDLFVVENGVEERINIKCLGCGNRISQILTRNPDGLRKKKQRERL